MENYKKRKTEETFINMDPNILQNIIQNQEKMISYIYQIGTLSENTLHTLQNIENKINDLQNRIDKLEIKNTYVENSVNKVNHTFIQELKNKEIEIETLKELNKNIIDDYNKFVQSTHHEDSKKNNDSFYL